MKKNSKQSARPNAPGNRPAAVAASGGSLLAPPAGWTFLTNHTHVLLCLHQRPDMLLREVAQSVGITERMVQRIVSELVEAGYVSVEKQGRCNRYAINPRLQLRHPLEMHHTIGELLELLAAPRR